VLIGLLIAVGFTPVDSNTVHIYTQNTQKKHN